MRRILRYIYIFKRDTRALCHALYRILRHCAFNAYRVGDPAVKPVYQRASARKQDPVLYYIAVQLRRSQLQNLSYTLYNIVDIFLKLTSQLVRAYLDRSRKSGYNAQASHLGDSVIRALDNASYFLFHALRAQRPYIQIHRALHITRHRVVKLIARDL